MDVSLLCVLTIFCHLCGSASLLHMMTRPQTFVMNAKESQVLECKFEVEYFNLFDNPVLWKKRQGDEVTQVAISRLINEPFVHTNRFEHSYTPSSPTYTFKLAVVDLTLEDSGNYTCEVYGIHGNTLLASVTHNISVRAPVETTYITNGNETDFLEEPAVLHYSENEPGTLRCISVGGFPPPDMLVRIGDRDITPELKLTHYTQLTGEKGLRLMSTTTQRSTHSLYALPEDDGKEVQCIVTVKGLFSEPIKKVPIRVNFAPVIKCYQNESRASLYDHNVYLRCTVTARPSVKALFWIIDTNGTTVENAAVVHDNYWSLVKQLGNGVLETKLFIRTATKNMFRTYTVVAQNSVSMSTRQVRLFQKKPPRRQSEKIIVDTGSNQDAEPDRHPNGYTNPRRSHCAIVQLNSVLLLCTFGVLWWTAR